MAQPSVAREPSMEEILASIRRIIESNEPQAENALHGSLPPVYGEDDEGEIDIVTDVANDPGEPPRLEALQSTRTEAAQEPAMSLADVAARVRAASARQMENGTVRLPTPPAVEPPVQRAEVTSPAADMLERVPLRPQHDVVTSEAPVAAPASAAPQAPARPDVLGNAFAGSLSDAAARPEPKTLPAKVEAAAALLSQETGAQVARSFGELAAVFDGVEARSLEEVAQDMLRPMLQGWLDDNLPTLVERLVREEIERVARGPRR